jgi:transcriptional regulator with XRE-family HTH domain
MCEIIEILGSNIRKLRKECGWTQEKLAEKTGLSAQTINDIEGCRTWVSDKSLIKIAEALHISPADLLIEHGDKNSSIINITSSDIYKLKKELKDTFLDSIESVFVKYTNINE